MLARGLRPAPRLLARAAPRQSPFRPHASAAAAAAAAKDDQLVVLCILDGWGYRETAADNAVIQAPTPAFDSLFGSRAQTGQVAFLDACEGEVGLPVGQIGNSEVGHMNIGAGRVVYQDICTIDNAIEDGSLPQAAALVEHIEALQASGGTSHLIGLVSPGGVHSMQNQVAALANAVAAAGVPVVVHAFTDGRDVPPSDAISTMPDFEASLDDGVTIGTVTGRYYAMDRDNRWERVITAFDAVVSATGVAPGAASAQQAIEQGYADGLTDEFINPTIIGGYGESPCGALWPCAAGRASRVAAGPCAQPASRTATACCAPTSAPTARARCWRCWRIPTASRTTAPSDHRGRSSPPSAAWSSTPTATSSTCRRSSPRRTSPSRSAR